MSELIKVQVNVIGAEEVNSVNAREIHEYLGVKTRFNDWIQRAIKKYDFVENVDYVLVTQKRVTNNPKNPTATFTEYIVTLDMAKELSMLENNAKGKETRKYFIKCEREAMKLANNTQDDTQLIGVVLKLVENQQKQTDAILSLVESIKTAPQIGQQPQTQQVVYLDSRDRKKLRDAIQEKAKEVARDLGVSVSTISPAIWIELKNFFDVDDYQDIHKSQLKDVMHFVMFWEPRNGSIKQDIEIIEL